MGVLDLDNVFERSNTSHSLVNHIEYFILNIFKLNRLESLNKETKSDNNIILHFFKICITIKTTYPKIQFSV